MQNPFPESFDVNIFPISLCKIPKRGEKKDKKVTKGEKEKKVEKNSKKVLTKGKRCDRIIKLSARAGSKKKLVIEN